MVSLSANLSNAKNTSDIHFILIDFDEANLIGQYPLGLLL